ncbi:DUF924 family protein [Jannaschia sp. W003]|uniref:DUF924 family protein n=1 Tax=Jannaschia sp. W003 TaxID=2867012 RepID=UPI0021A66CAC|nr:DUF924 family protein [Jannaschia sp. W003]UWQ20736.1 DUF924 domain-containing protein [Jannaschia sp. W003]
MTETAETVCRFWLEECEPKDWYVADDALDARIRERFLPTWEAAMAGALDDWPATARGALGFLILTDQFPRNMFRGSGRAFASDPLALAVAKQAIRAGQDREIPNPGRQFFYLPLEHSETGPDQHRAVRLILGRMESTETLLHARAHREVIRRYGRFPYRNEALGRESTEAERAMVEAGGYGAVLRELQAQAA